MIGQPERTSQEQDEFFIDTPEFRRFMQGVRETIEQSTDVTATLDALQPRFAALLADDTWLPDEFASPFAESGMGGGIASWLLYRSANRSLSLISLVVPPGSETPVHDHLAWGFVGLYRGEQEEKVFARQSENAGEHDHPADYAALSVVEVNYLKPGDFYRLIPPDGDIHSVKTTSAQPSVSIHLLTNDIGCVLRHAYDPEQATARPFRSGYSNVACEE